MKDLAWPSPIRTLRDYLPAEMRVLRRPLRAARVLPEMAGLVLGVGLLVPVHADESIVRCERHGEARQPLSREQP